ncbi:TetR/AcrR family transcriptional regulator [Actinotalea solisilvae]|uniref:TetR/AcrR family transcriptional regulator n=1 Tax=Actinotalea solisilvae TaxID=2072922 RepID=UPI0027DCB8FF|nr:TetR/AcrR family transcriptional regulator [Actinotalea solisilvae]
MTTPTPPRPRATRMGREARRAQVLAVAQDLFAREGFHHVSMDDIADRAEVSKPVLYRHFPSKLDLYLAVVDHRGQALVTAVDEALAAVDRGEQQSGRAVVRGIVQAYVEFVEQAGDSFSLLFESDVTRDSGVRSRVEQASADAARAICRALRELAGLPLEHAELLSTALVGMARVAATSRYRTQDVGVEDAVDLVTQLAWRGVAGLVRDREGADAG